MSEEKINLQGRRIEEPKSFDAVQDGDYWKNAEGDWYVACPNSIGMLSHIAGPTHKNPWNVVEHEDGTISVKPSLLLFDRWHGYLTKGFFQSC